MIRHRVHIARPREEVYALIATDEGRARFWGESAIERDGAIHFVFPNGLRTAAPVLERVEPERFVISYFASAVAFDLADDGEGGTDVTLTDESSDPDTNAGWVSVLLELKAAAFGIDLRNHDPARTWDQGYADN